MEQTSLYLLYPSYFLTGLLGGFGHCLGMCGPLVLAWTSRGIRGPGPLIQYNLGRVFSYFSLGLMVSLLGSGIVSEGFYRAQSIVMAALAVLMVFGGLGIILPGTPRWFPQIVPSNLVRTFMERGPFPLGIVNGFFPCGLVYTALMGVAGYSVGLKSPALSVLNGGLLMALFGLGTSVSMFLLGFFSDLIQNKLRPVFYKLSGLLMIAVGGFLLWKAIR